MMSHCCERMKEMLYEEKTGLVFFAKFREYGILILDGGTSFQEIYYCPWCGSDLPKSLRNQWFDALESLGIDPLIDEIPIEFSDQSWWANK